MALVIFVAVFGLYEVLEQNLFVDLDHTTRHVVKILNWVIPALLSLSVVGWYALRGRHSIFPKDTNDPDGTEPFSQFAQDSAILAHHVAWFIRARWIAAVIATVLIVLSTTSMEILDISLLLPLMLCIAVLVLSNVIFHARAYFGTRFFALVLVSILADLVILTCLLHFSGGLENPLWILYIFHVIISGILLGPKVCYLIALVATLTFSSVVLLEMNHLLPHYRIGVYPHEEASSATASPDPVEGEEHDAKALSEHDGGDSHDDNVEHASHDPRFVTSGLSVLVLVLFLTAYFVTTVMERLRSQQRQTRSAALTAIAERLRLERVVDATRIGLRVFDVEMGMVWVNERFQEWLALWHAESQIDLDHLMSCPVDPDAARQAMEAGSIRSREREIATVSPSRWFHLMVLPVRDNEGRIFQVVELLQDITERKTTQAQLVQAGKLAAVGELVGNMAHEVNNPMAIISTKASVLLEDPRQKLSERVTAYVQEFATLADRVAEITRSLLQFSRPSTGQKELTDVHGPIRSSLALLTHPLESAGIQIETRFMEPLPPVMANGNELEQVFVNLISNAVDAMAEAETRKLTLVTSLKEPAQGGGAVEVIISDTGGGISSRNLERIFEPFFTTREGAGGTGLGLSICVGLVRSHGGTIDVHSEVGKGTTFTVILPCPTESQRTKATKPNADVIDHPIKEVSP